VLSPSYYSANSTFLGRRFIFQSLYETIETAGISHFHGFFLVTWLISQNINILRNLYTWLSGDCASGSKSVWLLSGGYVAVGILLTQV